MIDNQNNDEKNGAKDQFEWNKKGFEPGERLSLRIDVREANQYQAEKGKIKIGELPNSMKKLRKKVRDSYDEVDEGGIDEDVLFALRELQINVADASNGDNTLLNAVSSDERRMIDQNTTIEISRQQQNAGKLNALQQADRLSKQAGITTMSAADYASQMQEAIYNPRRTREKSLELNIAKKVGLKGEIKKHNVGKVVKGVKQIVETTDNRKVKNMDMGDAAKVGQKKLSQKATAELILQKSGQSARLSEIKMKISKSATAENMPKKSYDQEMKKLLKESLRKNNKVR